MWRSPFFDQDPGRIEVPVCIDEARINPADLGDPVPCKPPIVLAGATKGMSSPGTPTGLAEDPSLVSDALGGSVATFTHSQPNSATSSLASLLTEAELQGGAFATASRDSSFRSSLDLSRRVGHHSRLSSFESEASHDDALEAIVHFDSDCCAALPPVKLQNSPGCAGEKMVPVFMNLQGTEGCDLSGLGMAVRPLRMLSHTMPSGAGTYNPYDLSRSLAEFKLARTSSPAAGARPPPPNPGAHAPSTLGLPAAFHRRPAAPARPASGPRPSAMGVPRARAVDDEPAYITMIPGMRRVIPPTTTAT